MANKKVEEMILWGCCFFSPIILYSITLFLCSIYPLGSISNLTRDLHIQYVDLLSYLWNVLHGKARIVYTFSKSLGGSAIGIFAYYLSSPINLLLYLFEKQDIQLFVYFAIAIKLGLCGLFQAIFLRYRIPELKKTYVFLLSMCYAISFYNMHQMDNLMWLDGVYMLPIVMLGVWRVIENKKNILLIIAVCCSICFNWYTAYMVCLFAGIYFIYELLLKEMHTKEKLRSIVIFIGNMLLGIMLSFAFFLPVIYSLKQGKGTIESGIFNIKFNGDITQLMRGFVTGNDIGDSNLSLFCGTIVLIFVIYYFVTIFIERKWKKALISSVLLVFMLSSVLFKPFENIWNGFRVAESYFCRFSFLQTWILIYFAACGLGGYKDRKKIVLSSGIFLLALFQYLNFEERFPNQRGYCITLISIVVILMVFGLKHALGKNKYLKVIALSCLTLITLSELLTGGIAVGKELYWDNADRYINYVKNQENQLSNIYDDSLFYRIEQTFNREENQTKCTAYFNENLAYDYRGFSQYTSTYNEKLRKLGEQFGYGINGVITMYDEPILPSDSLLGIKYVMSNQEFGGLLLQNDNRLNDKNVYKNPYALPLGFKVASTCNEYIEINNNNFEFQNAIFSYITGKRIRLFEPIKYNVVEKQGGVDYILETDSNNDLVYGYADIDIQDVELYIDDVYRCNYQRWLSYRVFNVGKISEQHTISFKHKDLNNEEQINPVFYKLDMEKFEKVISDIKKETLELSYIKDGVIKGRILTDKAGYILLTVPNERGWKAYINEKRVEIETGCNALIMLPVESGNNVIELKYQLPYMKLGIALSILAVMLCVYIFYWERRNHSR